MLITGHCRGIINFPSHKHTFIFINTQKCQRQSVGLSHQAGKHCKLDTAVLYILLFYFHWCGYQRWALLITLTIQWCELSQTDCYVKDTAVPSKTAQGHLQYLSLDFTALCWIKRVHMSHIKFVNFCVCHMVSVLVHFKTISSQNTGESAGKKRMWQTS